MWYLEYIVAPIVGGILAASGFIVAKKPDAKELIDKLAPYQGTIGVVLLALGVWNSIAFLPHAADFIKILPFFGIAAVITIVAELLLGFLLGFGLVAKYIGRGSQAATEKGAQLQKKLVGIQVPVGFLGI